MKKDLQLYIELLEKEENLEIDSKTLSITWKPIGLTLEELATIERYNAKQNYAS